jgi:hypothetical protein
MSQTTDVPARQTEWRKLATEFAIALVIVIASGWWASQFWNTWTSRGGQPVFYQSYFEPAVMVACGKGFVASQRQPPSLQDFLLLRRDAFDCRDLPNDLRVGQEYVYQGAWFYLQTAVGWAWRFLGISWSGMGPLFGFMFGSVIALAYGVFRLGMSRGLAVACACLFATSPMHLANLPHLRDYAKAPFTIALILLLGLMVTRPVRRNVLLGLAAAYGAVLGIGYGVRTDLLINVPLVFVTLFGFLPGGVARHLALKAGAAALCAATFVVVSWPVTSTVYTKGGCQWHVALLGLQSPFDDYLRITPAPYDFGHAYSDGYIRQVAEGFANRTQPEAGPIGYCTPEYDAATGRYIQNIATTFPADLATRAVASITQMVELPIRKFRPPMEEWASGFYSARAFVFRPNHRWGAYFTLAAVILVGMTSLRLGLFVGFLLAYCGGYPAVQFDERHFFHLEFMGWWAFGVVLHRAFLSARPMLTRPVQWREPLMLAARSAAAIAVSCALLGMLLIAARWYQARNARDLMKAYMAAPKQPIEDPGQPLSGVAANAWPQLLEVRFDAASCRAAHTVTARYDAASPNVDLTRTIAINSPAHSGITRIYIPVFDAFSGLAFSGTTDQCAPQVSRLSNLASFPLVLGATLAPDWEERPLYQRLTDWERRLLD